MPILHIPTPSLTTAILYLIVAASLLHLLYTAATKAHAYLTDRANYLRATGGGITRLRQDRFPGHMPDHAAYLAMLQEQGEFPTFSEEDARQAEYRKRYRDWLDAEPTP
jgi:hypothetical protein